MGKELNLSRMGAEDLVSSGSENVVVVKAQEELSRDSGLFSGRLEQTAAGMIIGATRDIFGEAKTLAEKEKRAETSDFLGHVVADAVVMIPRFKAVKAGMARTALLANPHDGLAQDPLDLGKNFLEGAALNKVSRAVLPGSSLTGLTGRYLGDGLKAEAATHMTAGFGFGAVKSGFDARTWLDNQGNFSVGSGLESMAKTGTAAALINLPAGMVGMRSAQWGGRALKAETLSPRAHSFFIGATSGYTSGAVVGGIEAFKEGKGFYDTLEQMNQAGLIGAGTGGLLMSVAPLEKPLYSKPEKAGATRQSKETSIDLSSELSLSARAKMMEIEPALPAGRRKILLDGSDDLAVAEAGLGSRRRKIPVDELEYQPRETLKLTDLSRQLIREPNQTRLRLFVPEEASKKTYSSYEEFAPQIKGRHVDTRIYKFKGSKTEIEVSESYAVKLDQIRILRHNAAAPNAYDQLPSYQRSQVSRALDPKGPEFVGGSQAAQVEALAKFMTEAEARQSLMVLRARDELMRNPENSKALPEDILVVLQELPNPSLVKRVVIDEGVNPNDIWTRQSYDPDFVSAATASPDGEITFYKPTIDFFKVGADKVNLDGNLSRAELRGYANHEWSHLGHFSDPLNFGLFKLAEHVDAVVPSGKTAATLEDAHKTALERPPDQYFMRTYARRNSEENWAVHMGESFLAPESHLFADLAERAPVRTTVLGRSINAKSTNSQGNNVHGESIAKRTEAANRTAMPAAQKVLEQRIATGSDAQKVAAVELLGHMGSKERHIRTLLDVADSPESLLIKDNVETLSGGYIRRSSLVKSINESSLADAALDNAIRIAGNGMKGESEVAFLIRQVRESKGQVRDLSLERLRRMDDGFDLARFATMAGDADNLPAMMDMLPSIRDRQAQNMVFDEIMALGAKGEYGDGFVNSILIDTIKRVPALRIKATNVLGDRLARDPDMAIGEPEKLLRLWRGHSDEQFASRARKIVDTIEARREMIRAVEMMDSPDGAKRLSGIDMATKHHDRSLIAPLLKVVASGNADEVALAARALRDYEWQMVKHEAGVMQSENPEIKFDANLRYLIQG